MPKIKRWTPVVGGGILVAFVILRLFGLNDLAQAIAGFGGAVGLTDQSPVGIAELTAAAAGLTGIVLKIRAEVQKARGKA
jgi:hypothetical protein